MSPRPPEIVLQWRLSWGAEIKSWIWDFFFALLSVLDIPLKSVSNFEGGIMLKDNPLPHHAMHQRRPSENLIKRPQGAQ